MPNQTDGSWDALQDWPLIGLHATVMDDGRVLTFGTDARGMQSGQFIYDIYDPATGTHQTLQNTTPTDIFCSAAVIIPGTNKILIAGGDARPLGSVNTGVNDVNIIDMDTGEIYPAPNGDMAFQRWYPTMVSLPTGQMVAFAGTDIRGRGISTPEIYTHGEGWKSLTGAVDTDLGAAALYTRSFVDNNGDVIYFSTGRGNNNQYDVKKLDTDGNGSVTSLGTLPFTYNWDSPAVMYEAGKILIQDAGTGLWSMDITGDTPVYQQVGSLSQQRNWSNMTTLADGSVLINGGTEANGEAGADTTAVIWDPETNQLNYTVDEDNPRLYHSASVLLNDGTLLSLGGGAASGAENNYLDGQVYRPPYLYDDNGNLATRPVITDAPDDLDNGESFTITLGNASDIQKLTMVKSGAATHAFNMDTRQVELDFTQGPGNTLNVTLPQSSEGVVAGSWMLFAWNSEGVPSIAPMVSVNPEFNTGGIVDHNNLLDNGSFETAADVTDWEIHDYVFGWESSNNNFELWQDGFAGVSTSDGATQIEIDGERGTISQSVESRAGQSYDLAFDYTARSELIESTRMEVLWNGQVIATITPTNAEQQSYEFTVIGTGGEDTLAFRSLEQTNDSYGGLLDNVSLKAGIAVDPNNLLHNGGFEVPTTVSNFATFSDISGWNSTNNNFEIWNNGFNGVAATEGNTFIEIDAERGTISQEVNTTAGENYSVSFDYAGRPGHVASSKLDVLWNGQVIATITPASSQHQNYEFDVVGTGGQDTLAFRTVAGDTDKEGGMLDNVVMQVSDNTSSNVLDIANQTQYLTGNSNDDTFVINGNASDYGWGPTQDGIGIVVWGPTGFDLLYDFEAIKFNDETISLGSTGQTFEDIANVTQFLTGTAAEDSFVINGASSEYGWGPTEDGQGTVVWGPTGFDLLYNIENIQFNDTTVLLDGSGSSNSVDDIAGQVQHLTGTASNDQFVINGDSGDFGWGATQDGLGTVVWNNNTGVHDLLYDFEEIAFSDQTVSIDQIA